MGIFIFLIGLLYFLIQVDSVQTFVTHRITAYLSEKLHTKVSIDGVSIRFVKSAVLKGFYVEDLHGDTLVYAGELNVAIEDLIVSKNKLDIDAILLKDGKFSLKKYKNEKHDNLYFLTNYFSSSDTTTTGKPWLIKVRNVSLKNFVFENIDEDDTATVEGVNFSNLKVSNINGDFSEIHSDTGFLNIQIRSLTFADQSGFKVDNFSADAKLSSKEVELKNLIVRTPQTDIRTNLTFRFDSFASFDEFTSQVNWTSDFKKSLISFTDIAYFAPDLAGLDRTISLEGDFKGAVNNFKGKNVVLKWGSRSQFLGDISMRGLPVIDDTYAEIHAQNISSNKADLEWLPVAPFKEHNHVMIPENLRTLGDVTFKGKYTGFFRDFVAYGNIHTALGSINSDLNLKYNEHTKTSAYSGHISATNFDVGKVAMVSDLGKVTFSLKVKGSGLRLDNINANLEGNFEQLEFRNYEYKNVAVNAQVAKKLFNGSLNVKEDNVDLGFEGSIDYRGKLPVFNFNADINTARLDLLNLYKPNDYTVLQTHIQSHFKGNKLDNIEGNIDISNTNLTLGKKLYHMNSITMDARLAGNVRSFDILSDNVDAHFNGQFELGKLGDAIKEILPQYLPSVILPSKTVVGNQNFTFDVRIKNLNVFTELAFPSWDFAPNTTLKGHLNTIENTLSLKINSEWIKFKEYSLDNFVTDLNGKAAVLTIETKMDKVRNGEKVVLDFPQIRAEANNNKVKYSIRLNDFESEPSRAHLEGTMNFFSATNFNFKIDSSLLVIENEEWKLDPNNMLVYDSSFIDLNSFILSKGDESFKFDGVISRKENDRVQLNLTGFNLTHLNSILKSSSTLFGGYISGNIFLKDALNHPQLETDLNISNLTINGDTLGNTSIKSEYDIGGNIILTDVEVVKGIAKIIDIKGKYFINKEKDNLDFTIKLENLYLRPLQRYIDNVMTDLNSKMSADLHLGGTIKRPVFDGTVSLNKTSLVVDYLKTRYSFNTTIKVKENEFIIDELKINDVHNNVAIANGKITHYYFSDFRFDIELQANKFQVLNTTLKDNSQYYGIANASGYAHFKGPIDNMNMDISMSPDKGTIINIPLNTSEDLSHNNFITFINRSRADSTKIQQGTVDLSGVTLNMNLDMNPNALINIIFDEKIGDVISGNGNGSLRLDINTAGNFNMYGTYIISKGDYLFTLQNLMNKKFKIDPGGRISWTGDPFEAVIDLSAVYVVYTSSLYQILPEDSAYKRRVPVDCRIILTNKLMNPTISYEIKVRGLSPTEESVINTKVNSEEQIDKQMFGLLLFNQFVPSSGTGQSITKLDAGAGAGASATEVLSNQLSNLLGQISTDVNIGIDYRAKDEYSDKEIRLLLSKTLLDDRLTLDVNVGYLEDQTYTNTNVVGDFYAEYKVRPDGHVRVKGFNRSNVDNIIDYSESPYTQGFGIFYRKDFDNWKDLILHWRNSHRKEAEVASDSLNTKSELPTTK